MPKIISQEAHYLEMRSQIKVLKIKLEVLSKSEALHKRRHVQVMAWLKTEAPELFSRYQIESLLKE